MKWNILNKRIGGFLLLLLILILSTSCLSNKIPNHTEPICKDGSIDLSHWNFNEDGNVKLSGTWEFYPNKLLTTADFQGNNLKKPIYIDVPHRWLSDRTKNVVKDQGIGTYRLKVRINEATDMYGIKTTNIRSACNIYINGKKVGESGNPAKSIEAGYVSNVLPIIAVFPSDGEELEIVIQVANLDYYNGGIIQNIYLGKDSNILKSQFRLDLLDMAVMSFLLLSGIYYLAIYISRKKDVGFLYFGMACLTYSYISATGGEKILNRLCTEIPFMFLLKLKIAFVCASIIFLALCIRKLGEAFIPRKLIKFILSIMACSILIILLIPIKYVSVCECFIWSFDISVYSSVAITMFRAILNKKYGTLNKMASVFLLSGVMLFDIQLIAIGFYLNSIIDNNLIPYFSLLYLLTGIAVMLAMQHARAYNALESLSQKLMEADKQKDEFLIDISHEFKTPLHGIINIAQANLNNDTQYSLKKREENLTYIISIATRLSNLVNDIIDFQSLKNNSLRLNKKVFDLNGSVQVIVEVLKYMRKGDEIKLINQIPEGKYFLNTDENRVRQIMVNLISNALKYTEKGSIEVSAEFSDDSILIRIKDTGIGIQDDIKKVIFKRSMNTTDTNFSNHTSTGIGLSISKLLANSMGGDLSLEWTEVGAGSIFVLELPKGNRKKDSETFSHKNEDMVEQNSHEFSGDNTEFRSTVPYPTIFNESDTNRIKVLLADDEPSNIKVLQELFREDCYETLVAYNGLKALDLLKIHRDVSLVLLDVMMPGLSGYEVCRKIREEYELFELPILLLTVKNSAEDITVGLEAGANDFLTKPFELKELKARVRTLLQMKEAVQNAINMETVFLQSQIKPHFLYNALSVIISLCFSDGERAGNLLVELSNYLRGTFDIDPHNSMTTLKKELSLVKSYSNLEKERFGERLEVAFHIEEAVLQREIPALIIQPIVENSIKHGLMKRISGGTVEVFAEEVACSLRIKVKDNGIGMSPEKQREILEQKTTGSIALKNVNKRLLNEYGEGLSIESIEGQGTTVTINIPLNDGKRERSSYDESIGC